MPDYQPSAPSLSRAVTLWWYTMGVCSRDPAIVAREFSLSAVVGRSMATKVIGPGMMLRSTEPLESCGGLETADQPRSGDRPPALKHMHTEFAQDMATPHNFPVQLTSFVGREREQAEVRSLLGATRLLHAHRVGRSRQDQTWRFNSPLPW